MDARGLHRIPCFPGAFIAEGPHSRFKECQFLPQVALEREIGLPEDSRPCVRVEQMGN
jgi:hypothetical protein